MDVKSNREITYLCDLVEKLFESAHEEAASCEGMERAYREWFKAELYRFIQTKDNEKKLLEDYVVFHGVGEKNRTGVKMKSFSIVLQEAIHLNFRIQTTQNNGVTNNDRDRQKSTS